MNDVEKKILNACENYVDLEEGRRLELTYPFSTGISLHVEISYDWKKRAGTILLRGGNIEIHTDKQSFRDYFDKKLFD